MLEEYGGGECIDIVLTPPGGSALFPDGPEGERGGEPLVPELDGKAALLLDQTGKFPGRAGALAVAAIEGEGEADDQADRLVSGEQLEKSGHGEALTAAANQSSERGGEELGFVAQRQADAQLAPVQCQDSTGRGDLR